MSRGGADRYRAASSGRMDSSSGRQPVLAVSGSAIEQIRDADRPASRMTLPGNLAGRRSSRHSAFIGTIPACCVAA